MFLPFSLVNAQTPTNTPVWTDVMNSTNCTTMECGNFFPLGSGTSSKYQTDLASLPTPNTLNLAGVTLPTTTNYTWNCGGTTGSNGTDLSSTAVTFIETYSGSGVTGVGFLGTFVNKTPFTLTVNGQATNLFETVFFNENQCYGANGVGGGNESDANGREYGIMLPSAPGAAIYAYWGTKENVSTAQVNFPLTTGGTYGTNMQTAANGAASPVADNEYYFEMYPVQTNATPPANCSFQINVYNSNNTVTPIYEATVPVNGGPNANKSGSLIVTVPATTTAISGSDSSFCNVIAATAGDTGFVSANVAPPAGASGSLPSTSNLNLNMQRLFVGKD
jgi:hypothetical protein